MLRMKLDPKLSEQIDFLRFPVIAGIVFAHAYGSEVGLAGNVVIGVHETGFAASFIMVYVTEVLVRLLVPLFCLIAGFLFFYDFSFSKSEYCSKLRSRIGTLVIPFIFWNLFVLSVMVLIEAYPATAGYLSGKHALISSYDLFDYVNAIFGLTRMPIAYQFWFIRDLILIILLVPFIALALKHRPYLFLSLLMAVWLAISGSYSRDVEALCFFCLGAFLGMKRYDFSIVQKYGGRCLLVYFGITIADALTQGAWFNPQLHRIGMLIAVCGAFYLAAQLIKYERVKRSVIALAPAGFFVFAAHEPLLTAIAKFAYAALLPTNDAQVMAIYFAAPCVTIVLCLLAYKVSGLLLPNFTRVVTGGRSPSLSTTASVASIPSLN